MLLFRFKRRLYWGLELFACELGRWEVGRMKAEVVRCWSGSGGVGGGHGGLASGSQDTRYLQTESRRDVPLLTVSPVQEGRRAPAGSAAASLEGRGLQNATLSTGGCRTSSTMFWRDPEDGPSSITPMCKYVQTAHQTGAL